MKFHLFTKQNVRPESANGVSYISKKRTNVDFNTTVDGRVIFRRPGKKVAAWFVLVKNKRKKGLQFNTKD